MARYRMLLVPDEEGDGWAVSFPDLPGCITCGRTLEEAMRNADDACREWLLSTAEMKSASETVRDDKILVTA